MALVPLFTHDRLRCYLLDFRFELNGLGFELVDLGLESLQAFLELRLYLVRDEFLGLACVEWSAPIHAAIVFGEWAVVIAWASVA